MMKNEKILLLPLIKWGQNKREIFLTVLISNAINITYEAKLKRDINGDAYDHKKEEINNSSDTMDQFQFRCDQENDKEEKRTYGFEIELEHAVKKENIFHKTLGYGIQFVFQKCFTECIP